MAAISSEIEIEPAQRNTRVNEIIAIGLVALGLLLFLCLFSYNPNDPSWNGAGETGTHNWIGAVGANVAAGLFQGIGLAAYLLPFLFLAAAWRRIRSRRINAPVSRLAGLIVLVLSSAALLSLANIKPFFDASFNAGGLVGTGCVAEVFSPGTFDAGAGFSGIGHTGFPVTRSSKNNSPILLIAATAGMVLPPCFTSISAGAPVMSASQIS